MPKTFTPCFGPAFWRPQPVYPAPNARRGATASIPRVGHVLSRDHCGSSGFAHAEAEFGQHLFGPSYPRNAPSAKLPVTEITVASGHGDGPLVQDRDGLVPVLPRARHVLFATCRQDGSDPSLEPEVLRAGRALGWRTVILSRTRLPDLGTAVVVMHAKELWRAGVDFETGFRRALARVVGREWSRRVRDHLTAMIRDVIAPRMVDILIGPATVLEHLPDLFAAPEDRSGELISETEFNTAKQLAARAPQGQRVNALRQILHHVIMANWADLSSAGHLPVGQAETLRSAFSVIRIRPLGRI